MSFWALSGLINALTAFLFGSFIYFKNRDSYQNKVWALFSSTIVFWSINYFLWQISNDESMALHFSRSLMAGAIFIPVTFLHFLLTWLDLLERRKNFLYICYAISFITLGFNFTKLYITGVIPISYFKYWPQAGPAYLPFLIFWAIVVIYGIYVMVKAMAKSSAMRRNQIRYVLLGALIGYGGGFTNFPLWFGIKIPPYGNILVSVYVALLSYAIVKYRLMDIRVAVTNAGIFAIVYALVLGVPFYIGYNLKETRFWYLPLIVSTILASSGPFIYSIIRRRAENRLRREEFLAHKALNRLAQNMMRFTNLVTLLKLIVHQVVKIMKVDNASIYLRSDEDSSYHLRADWDIADDTRCQPEFHEEAPIIKDILLRKAPILTEELRLGKTTSISHHVRRVQAELNNANAEVVIPAFKGDSLFGFLLLGKRHDKGFFSPEDLNLLMLLGNQAVLAIDNAMLFEREKTLLAEQSRRGALADMAPGVSHQFNNRLMAISTEAELGETLLGEKSFEEFSQEELKKLFDGSKAAFNRIMKEALRGRDIAKAILKKGKAKVEYVKTDIGPIIESALSLFKMSKTQKSLGGAREPEITLDVANDLPQLTLSESLIQDVFYNLVDNARDAIIMKNQHIIENKIKIEEMPYQGKITIKAIAENNKVVITVSDNGLGIKDDDRKKLFVPYFTTKATANKGTGMGLWTIRGFIESHKGTIAVDTQYARGTTFTITFPLKQ